MHACRSNLGTGQRQKTMGPWVWAGSYVEAQCISCVSSMAQCVRAASGLQPATRETKRFVGSAKAKNKAPGQLQVALEIKPLPLWSHTRNDALPKTYALHSLHCTKPTAGKSSTSGLTTSAAVPEEKDRTVVVKREEKDM